MDLSDLIRQPEDAVEEEQASERVKKDIWLAPNDILNGKGLNEVIVDLNYDPFMTNRALSYHIDCLFYVQEMNRCWQLPKQLQYDYLFYSIKKRYRPRTKWAKRERSDDVELMKKFYGYSNEKAEDALRLHTAEQIEVIRYKMREGGLNEKRAKKAT